MALLATTSSGISGEFQKYMDPVLLKHAVQLLTLAQLGQKKPFPKHTGNKVIRFSRGDIAAATNVNTSGEGIPTTTFRDYSYTFIDGTLVQYDLAAKISDVLTWVDLLNTLKNVTKVMGEDVALHADG